MLRLIAAGMSNTEVAAQLFVSEATVKTYVNRIFAKTQAATAPKPSPTCTDVDSTRDKSQLVTRIQELLQVGEEGVFEQVERYSRAGGGGHEFSGGAGPVSRIQGEQVEQFSRIPSI